MTRAAAEEEEKDNKHNKSKNKTHIETRKEGTSLENGKNHIKARILRTTDQEEIEATYTSSQVVCPAIVPMVRTKVIMELSP